MVLHELAHAWSTIGLPVERRHAFQVLRGWEHWSDYDLAEWRDNGTEQAAEIIAWGVSNKAAPTVQIDQRQLRRAPHRLSDLDRRRTAAWSDLPVWPSVTDDDEVVTTSFDTARRLVIDDHDGDVVADGG